MTWYKFSTESNTFYNNCLIHSRKDSLFKKNIALWERFLIRRTDLFYGRYISVVVCDVKCSKPVFVVAGKSRCGGGGGGAKNQAEDALMPESGLV